VQWQVVEALREINGKGYRSQKGRRLSCIEI
jgi:hypothetical protein